MHKPVLAVALMLFAAPFGFGGWVALTKGTGGMDVMMGDPAGKPATAVRAAIDQAGPRRR